MDGLLICLAYEKKEMSHFDKFQKHNIPVCSFHKIWNHPYSSHVKINNYQAAYDLTAHLLDAGCRSIAYVTHHTVNNIYQERLDGYKQALIDHQIKYDENLIIKSDLSADDGIMVAQKLFASSKLSDGLIVNGDTCAVSCMNTLRKLGILVPDEILIGSFNNETVASLSFPSLTTIDIQPYQTGQMAASQLINQIKHRNAQYVTASKICLQHTIVFRESTCKKVIKPCLMKVSSSIGNFG